MHGTDLPAWIPEAVKSYLHHVNTGRSMRALARDIGCPPSTISRRVRLVEHRRDDPLVDAALLRLGKTTPAPRSAAPCEGPPMTEATDVENVSDSELTREAPRILRRLTEQGACLALAPAMESAVVVRETTDGPALRTAIVERRLAEAMALKDWIRISGEGRVRRYRITAGAEEIQTRTVGAYLFGYLGPKRGKYG